MIAKGRCGTSERVSGKPINDSTDTAIELAKRNAARQLLPLAEIKAVEQKAKLNAEFDWQKAYERCAKVAGTKANVDIIINDLVQTGKLRQDNPSHYDRTEWLVIHKACMEERASLSAFKADVDNDGGDNPPSSTGVSRVGIYGERPSVTQMTIDWQVKLRECKDAAVNETRYDLLKSDLQREGVISDKPVSEWQDSDFETLRQACALDASLFNRMIGDDWTLVLEANTGIFAYERRYRFWLVTGDTDELREKCFVCRKTRSQASQLSDDLIL